MREKVYRQGAGRSPVYNVKNKDTSFHWNERERTWQQEAQDKKFTSEVIKRANRNVPMPDEGIGKLAKKGKLIEQTANNTSRRQRTRTHIRTQGGPRGRGIKDPSMLAGPRLRKDSNVLTTMRIAQPISGAQATTQPRRITTLQSESSRANEAIADSQRKTLPSLKKSTASEASSERLTTSSTVARGKSPVKDRQRSAKKKPKSVSKDESN
jgi:hypothetical protein